jgi:hypothetical protein
MLAFFCEQKNNYSKCSFLFHDGRVELGGCVQEAMSSFSPLLPDVWGEQALPSVSVEFDKGYRTTSYITKRGDACLLHQNNSIHLKQLQ